MLNIAKKIYFLFVMYGCCSPALASYTGCGILCYHGTSPYVINKRLSVYAVSLYNDSYVLLYSEIAREPLWVAERLMGNDYKNGAYKRHKISFYMDDRIPYRAQANLSDYRHSGYDRGHMAPAGDANSDKGQVQTFSITNVVPQTPDLNEGIWTGVEMAVRNLAITEKLIYVVTGPQFGTTIRTIGRNHVFVPIATWKAVYAPFKHAGGAYVCSNSIFPKCAIITIKNLINTIDIDPFPTIPSNEKETLLPLPVPAESPYRH